MRKVYVFFLVLIVCITLPFSLLCSSVANIAIMGVAISISITGLTWIASLYNRLGQPITLKDLEGYVWYTICDTMKYAGEPNLGFRQLVIIGNGRIVSLKNDLPEGNFHSFTIQEYHNFAGKIEPWHVKVIFMRDNGTITEPYFFSV